jgi:hypothetical protein
VTANGNPLDHVTPYDRFAWSAGEIERWLVSGAHRQELTAYFGALEYATLAALARRAARATAQPLQVVLVPGIMGSQLGLKRPPPLPPDVLWVDPIDIHVGRLAYLRLPATAPIVSLGVVLFSHLRLKLYLRAQGFAVEFHDYDWRLPVAQLGAALAQRLRAAAGARVAVVAHSMGGLPRAPLPRFARHRPGRARGAARDPNCGSFAAVQALRGTYAVAQGGAHRGRGLPPSTRRRRYSALPEPVRAVAGDCGQSRQLSRAPGRRRPTAAPRSCGPRASARTAGRRARALHRHCRRRSGDGHAGRAAPR